jgi:hypothetical protein
MTTYRDDSDEAIHAGRVDRDRVSDLLHTLFTPALHLLYYVFMMAASIATCFTTYLHLLYTCPTNQRIHDGRVDRERVSDDRDRRRSDDQMNRAASVTCGGERERRRSHAHC